MGSSGTWSFMFSWLYCWDHKSSLCNSSCKCPYGIFYVSIEFLKSILTELCRQEVLCPLFFSETWKHCLIHLGKQVLMLCFDIRSVIASSMFYALLRRLISLSLSHLSLMFRINIVESQFSRKESVSLLDSDDSCISEPTIPQMFEDQLKDLASFDRSLQLPDTSSKIFMQKKSHRFADQLEDLLTFDGSSELSNVTDEIFKEGDDDQGKRDISPETCGRIESMIEANFMGFVEQAKVTPVELCSSGNTALVKRR